MPTFIMPPDHLTVTYEDGDVVTVYKDSSVWDKAVQALREKDWEEIRELAKPVARVTRYGGGRVSVDDGLVTLDNTPVDGVLVQRMLDMADQDIDIEPLANFLVNLNDNPDYRAVNELYGFLEASNLTITPDGCFLAYKRVRRDYLDIYSRTFDNSIGCICEMPRNKVNPDKEETCSDGLHFCGRDYLSAYGTSSNGSRTMVIKINPRDVVSIPVDYDNHKGRCCRYEVVGELEHSHEAPLEGTVSFDYEDDYRDEDWLPEDDDGTESVVPTSFPSRQAAREFTYHNQDYVVRDRGAGQPKRWYVALRSDKS